jgi:putative glycerol-1-phosphate prenyltransferase
MNFLETISNAREEGKKLISILIDPDKATESHLEKIVDQADQVPVDFYFIGGSLLSRGDLDDTLLQLKQLTDKPLIIFPGSPNQISDEADGILFLSLLSSRNPDMLIGQQVIAAPYLKKTSLEKIATAYLLIESGAQTTASYMSNSNPIPCDKSEIAASTALAGEYMGMQLVYLDAGSGAKMQVPPAMIEAVRQMCDIPIIAGGGLKNRESIEAAFAAGADMVVIGDAVEKNPQFLSHLRQISR